MTRSLVLGLLALVLSGCWEENLEKADFNTYFYIDGKEEFLGLVHSLSACQRTAFSKAASLNISSATGWSYVCCKKTESSNCASKHK